MVKGIGPLFGLEVDGERKNLFGTLAKAKELETALVAEGCKVVLFEHSDAEIKARDAAAANEEFMKLGVQYYVAARQSAWSGLWVCGNLYHHALEMFLKAGLSRKYSLRELRKQFGHELIAIWNAFKDDFPSPALLEFDATIADIAGFEDIRYPDRVLKYGVQIRIDYRSVPQQSAPSSPPEYKLDSSPENRRQKEFKNREARVRRPADRRSVGWHCRRGGRRLRACWRAGDRGRVGGGSGCWRGDRRAVCGRRERAARPERPWG
jgi:hypothetical protein